MERSRQFYHRCKIRERFRKKTFSYLLFCSLAFWQSGACFSGSPFLWELEQIRAWQSKGLVVIEAACESSRGRSGPCMLGLGVGSLGSACVCVFRVYSVCTLCHVGLVLKVIWKKPSSGEQGVPVCLDRAAALWGLSRWTKRYLFQLTGVQCCGEQDGSLLRWVGRNEAIFMQLSDFLDQTLIRNMKCKRGCTYFILWQM